LGKTQFGEIKLGEKGLGEMGLLVIGQCELEFGGGMALGETGVCGLEEPCSSISWTE